MDMAMSTRTVDSHISPTIGSSMDSFNPFASNATGNRDLVEELRQAKREIELLKSMDPFRAADMAIEIQMEKMRSAEATSARDSAVQRLASAYESIKSKTHAITKLTTEKNELEVKLREAETRADEAEDRVFATAVADDTYVAADGLGWAVEKEGLLKEIVRLNAEVKTLKDEIDTLQSRAANINVNAMPQYVHASADVAVVSPSPTLILDVGTVRDLPIGAISNDIDRMGITQRPHSVAAFRASTMSAVSYPSTCSTPALKHSGEYYQLSYDFRASATLLEPDEMVKARNATLAYLPVPENVPDDVLSPIMIPVPFTIHEFLGNTTGSLRNSLSGYRAFQDKTTYWCPDREEHGYFLTPLFKCTTNPRVPTAHGWTAVDPKGRMNKPTECFFNKDGKWYYAGQYIAIRLEDLTIKEWLALDTEASTTLVKETLIGRKNVSPQNLYEISQLYAAGALKIACVGLQCVGFNAALNRTIKEQAAKCHASGRWRSSGWTGAPTLPAASCGDSSLGDASSSYGFSHQQFQMNTSDFDPSAPAAAAAASVAASVLDEGSSVSAQLRLLSMFNSM